MHQPPPTSFKRLSGAQRARAARRREEARKAETYLVTPDESGRAVPKRGEAATEADPSTSGPASGGGSADVPSTVEAAVSTNNKPPKAKIVSAGSGSRKLDGTKTPSTQSKSTSVNVSADSNAAADPGDDAVKGSATSMARTTVAEDVLSAPVVPAAAPTPAPKRAAITEEDEKRRKKHAASAYLAACASPPPPADDSGRQSLPRDDHVVASATRSLITSSSVSPPSQEKAVRAGRDATPTELPRDDVVASATRSLKNSSSIAPTSQEKAVRAGKDRTLLELAELRAKKLTKYIHRRFDTLAERNAAIRAAEEAILAQLELKHDQGGGAAGGGGEQAAATADAMLGVLDRMYIEQHRTEREARERMREYRKRLGVHGYVAPLPASGPSASGGRRAAPLLRARGADVANAIRHSGSSDSPPPPPPPPPSPPPPLTASGAHAPHGTTLVDVFESDVRVPEVVREIDDLVRDNADRLQIPTPKNVGGGGAAPKLSSEVPVVADVKAKGAGEYRPSTPVNSAMRRERGEKHPIDPLTPAPVVAQPHRAPSPAHSADHAAGGTAQPESEGTKTWEAEGTGAAPVKVAITRSAFDPPPSANVQRPLPLPANSSDAIVPSAPTAASGEKCTKSPIPKGGGVSSVEAESVWRAVEMAHLMAEEVEVAPVEMATARSVFEGGPSDGASGPFAEAPSGSSLSDGAGSAEEEAVRKAEEMARRMAEEVDWWCTTSGGSTDEDGDYDLDSVASSYGIASKKSDNVSTSSDDAGAGEDQWYTYWSEEHQREYYFNPHNNAVSWTLPRVRNEDRDREAIVALNSNQSDYVPVMDFTKKPHEETDEAPVMDFTRTADKSVVLGHDQNEMVHVRAPHTQKRQGRKKRMYLLRVLVVVVMSTVAMISVAYVRWGGHVSVIQLFLGGDDAQRGASASLSVPKVQMNKHSTEDPSGSAGNDFVGELTTSDEIGEEVAAERITGANKVTEDDKEAAKAPAEVGKTPGNLVPNKRITFGRDKGLKKVSFDAGRQERDTGMDPTRNIGQKVSSKSIERAEVTQEVSDSSPVAQIVQSSCDGIGGSTGGPLANLMNPEPVPAEQMISPVDSAELYETKEYSGSTIDTGAGKPKANDLAQNSDLTPKPSTDTNMAKAQNSFADSGDEENGETSLVIATGHNGASNRMESADYTIPAKKKWWRKLLPFGKGKKANERHLPESETQLSVMGVNQLSESKQHLSTKEGQLSEHSAKRKRCDRPKYCRIPFAYLISAECRRKARESPIFVPDAPTFMGIQ